MKTLGEIIRSGKVLVEATSYDGGRGFLPCLDPKRASKQARVIWSNGGGWDHVSVSWPSRCPTWDEMCRVKDIFFRKEEACVEYHPAEKDYVNHHPYCLHIWKPQDEKLPIPPAFFVGPKEGQSIEEVNAQANAYIDAYERGERR